MSSSDGNNDPTTKMTSSLNANDVLLGRGKGSSDYIGNVRFRSLVNERKEEYTGSDNYNEKSMIAREVYNEIHSRGGRFLKPAETASSGKNRLWCVASKSQALEKCKQALREKQQGEAKASSGNGETTSEKEDAHTPKGADIKIENEGSLSLHADDLVEISSCESSSSILVAASLVDAFLD